jgi:Protein of unknown function (DUF3800)
VRLVFLDDSGQSTPRRQGLGPLVGMGGVIVPETALVSCADGMQQIAASLGVPSSEELKWSPAQDSFLANAGAALRPALYRGLLELAIDLQARSVVVVWDRGRVDWPQEKVQVEILKWLYERISMSLANQTDIGVVIADEPGGGAREQRRWLADTLELTSYGTEYVTADRVVLPIVTTPSHHVRHLQLADLVVGATVAAVAGNRYALDLAPLLRQLAHKNAQGYAGGAGIKLFPDDLNNLHYWIFGEATFWKVGMNSGWSLPWDIWPYATDDGLEN